MATFGEIIYACLDLLKERSDDAYFTEDHILFLSTKMRSVLLERKYKQTRNSALNEMSEENKQQVCLMLQPATMLPSGCGGAWLQSNAQIPELMPGFPAVACTVFDLLDTNVAFIPEERMRYVGYNKWLHNIIYAAKSKNGYLYLRCSTPQSKFLQRVGLTGVFADPVAAAKLSHEACMTGTCDVMEQRFPLESGLIPSCIELVVNELIGPRNLPEDKVNNAKDDLPDNTAAAGVKKPVESSDKQKQEEQ